MLDRYRGAMLGLAVGDALGYPVEFLGAEEVRRRLGPQGVTDFVASQNHPPGTYSDDTQMAIAFAEGLLEAANGGLDGLMETMARHLVRWSQSPNNDRAPGSTCMSGCRRLARGAAWCEAGVPESKGCGSAIRTAPIGLRYHGQPDRLMAVANASSLMTHGHPCALAGAVANAYAVSLALDHTEPGLLLGKIVEATRPISREFAAKVGDGVPDVLPMEPDGAFDVLGDGWVAEEAVAGALYCFLRSPDDFPATVLAGANAPGDSDSIACIAGGISGAYNGAAAIPEAWREGVENASRLTELADGLYELAGRPGAAA